MAPVTATSAGIARQTIDDPELISLLERLSEFDNTATATLTTAEGDDDELWIADNGGDDVANVAMADDGASVDVDGLVAELDRIPRWHFQEQADLYEWIRPLNAMDAALDRLLEDHPSLLLLPRDEVSNNNGESAAATTEASSDAASARDDPATIATACASCVSILRFLSHLLRNATNKRVFNSLSHLSHLLAASSDELSSLAVEALSALAAPPALHRHQAPEPGQHATALHSSGEGELALTRLMGAARGWGTKGGGTGLLRMVTLDDDTAKRGEEFQTCGEVRFQYYREERMDLATTTTQEGGGSVVVEGRLAEVRFNACDDDATNKSTAAIYRECLGRIEAQLADTSSPSPSSPSPSSSSSSPSPSSTQQLPPSRKFDLLAAVRLARSFRSPSSRAAAIATRLRALACLVHGHPRQESVAAVFAAQPELCGELADLLRPTVSGGNVAGRSPIDHDSGTNDVGNDAMLALADSPSVPYDIRTLAVEALTALVARRDATGTLTNVARQTNVLAELGVGKGQYLGLLPTLIRYSLAALNSFLASKFKKEEDDENTNNNNNFKKAKIEENDAKAVGLELGLAFLRATRPPALPRSVREERALEFVDVVLTLTSAVISVPSGTASLTDCGIVPALVSAVALDGRVAALAGSPFCDSPQLQNPNRQRRESYSDCLLKFVTAQAIQILEGAIVTHNGALSAFHELKGVDVLVRRLEVEVHGARSDASKQLPGVAPRRDLRAARRVLLFSAVNCLTVVFHQHESGAQNPAAPGGGAQLRRPALRDVLLEIMDEADTYGGVLAALAATFLSDVMNSDPRVVHYVHECGLAESFLRLVMGRDGDAGRDGNGPALAPCGELIMALPNVLTALSLTESGAAAVADANPFPALLAAFRSDDHVMPDSRCLFNEMAAIVGTGLDELMRHNPALRPPCLEAAVDLAKRVAIVGKDLAKDEEDHDPSSASPAERKTLEDRRTRLLQQAHNVVQLLEQVLHNEDHIAAFLAADGLDAILDLALTTVAPGGRPAVAHAACLGGAAAGAARSATGGALASLVKQAAGCTSDPHAILSKVAGRLGEEIDEHERRRAAFASTKGGPLERVPALPLHEFDDVGVVRDLSCLFRGVAHVEWLTNCLADSIRAASNPTYELASLGRERRWKKEIASAQFAGLADRLSKLHRESVREACLIRTEEGFDERDEARGRRAERPLRYRIRIVCQEGAIVRNGIDIDRCEDVGNLEMGEIVTAYDRCINSSGVLRYRTSRGWVSELTRGHGRENITEVVDVRFGAGPPPSAGDAPSDRVECGVPDLRSVTASVLGRLHGSQSNLFASLEGIVSSAAPSNSFSRAGRSAGFGPCVVAAVKITSSNLRAALDVGDDEFAAGGSSPDPGNDVMNDVTDDDEAPSRKDAAKCMYLGNQLNLLYAALCEEKRNRHINVPLLLDLLVRDGWTEGVGVAVPTEPAAHPPASGVLVFSAVRFVLTHALRDAASRRGRAPSPGPDGRPRAAQRMSRAVASSLPPTLSLLRRLASRPSLVDTPLAKRLAGMKGSELASLLSSLPRGDGPDGQTDGFDANGFARGLHLELAKLSNEVWSDERFSALPAHVIYPWTSYMEMIVRTLEEAAKEVAPAKVSSAAERLGLLGNGRLRDFQDPTSRRGRLLASVGMGAAGPTQVLGRGVEREATAAPEPAPFEPSEESISTLAEMGFAREHALEALECVGSNQVEVAMEYALTHPPSSPATLERRRAAREERRERQRRIEAERAERPQRRSLDAFGLSRPDDVLPDADGRTQEDSNSPADNDAEEQESEPKQLTEEEVKAQHETLAAKRVKEYLDKFKDSLCKTCLDIIERSNASGDSVQDTQQPDAPKEVGDSDSVIIVISNFLLDLCRAYSPALETKVTTELLQQMKSKLDVTNRFNCRVKVGSENSFAALVHASVVIFRALPKSRPSVLRHGIVGMITHCIRNCTLTSALTLRSGKGTSTPKSPAAWPRWLAPALLLLEVMAQPTSVTLANDGDGGDDEAQPKPASKRSEYGKVLAEHKKQTSKLARTTRTVFLAAAAATSKDAARTATPKKKKEMPPKKQGDKKANTDEAPATEEGKDKPNNAEPSPLLPMPTFLPLLHSETAEACMLLCLQLLGLVRSKKGAIDRAHVERVRPPPAVVGAILALLVKLLRCRRLAHSCLQMGGADLILCHFSGGNSSAITLILRRMLEQDEGTLHTMMETEIRSAVAKIYKKQHPSHASSAQPKANLKSFMQACAPLICRDPVVFVKAVASSVKIQPPGSESSSLSSSRGSQVTLLNSEDRSKIMKHLSSNTNDTSLAEKPSSQEERRGRGRSKSPHRASLTKASKKSPTPTKTGNATSKNHCQGTPANHITSLILTEILGVCPDADAFDAPNVEQSYQSTLDLLGSLSDLVLAIPACGAAIHRFKLVHVEGSNRIHNAISGCPDPPQTAVSYFLHNLLPQPRPAPKQESEGTPISNAVKIQKRLAYNKTKMSQAAARLMVCLVARPGEGRRRVIADLVFALSGGDYPIDKNSPSSSLLVTPQRESSDREMWAFKSWGELCAGLSAPRSSSASLSNQDSNSALSFEVVKLFLECGAAHALMSGLTRIKLHHPMAASTASALVRPLEIFTRPSVYNTVSDMAQKEKAKLEPIKMSRESRRVTFGPSQRSESSFADDVAIDTAFDAHVAGIEDQSMDEESDDSIEDDDSEMIEVPPIDNDDSSSGGEISSDESEEESDEDSDEDMMDEDEDNDSGDGSEQPFSDGSEDEEVEEDWDFDNNDFFDAEDEANNPGGNNVVDDGMEGWTRVDGGAQGSRGLGGLSNMLLDMVQPLGQGRHQIANGGFLMDAAENILGNMLRGGEGGLEGLSELEDLGIRVVRGGDRGDGRGGSLGVSLGAGSNRASSVGNNVGGNLQVHQNGLSNGTAFGSRSPVDLSPMESVFAGPATGAGSQHDMPFYSNEDASNRQSGSPSPYYDTQLFPNGLQNFQVSRTQPSLHQLLRPIHLPPINSLVSTLLSHEDNNSSQDRMTVAASGSFITGSNGNIIRLNDRFHTHEGPDRLARRTARPSTIMTGWVDDSLPPDRASEEFSAAFGNFLQDIEAQQQQSQSDNQSAPNNDHTSNEDDVPSVAENPPRDASNTPEEHGESPSQNVGAPEESAVPGESADDSNSSNGVQAAQESQLEAAEASTLTDATNNTEGTDDAVMEGDRSVGENVENNAGDEEAAQAESAAGEAVDAEETASNESNEEENASSNESNESNEEEDATNNDNITNEEANLTNNDQLACPPDIDVEVFNSLPFEMQQEIVREHQDATQISESGLDPEALAALPEDMRREIIEQEQQQQRLREQEAAQPAADPANAEEMDNASFLASLSPDLRQDILLNESDAFISSLPANLIAEANILRERAALQHRRRVEETNNASNPTGSIAAGARPPGAAGGRPSHQEGSAAGSRGRRQRNGKLRIESDRSDIVYTSDRLEDLGPLLTTESAKSFLRLLYLLSPVQPQRMIHKLVLNMCLCGKARVFFLNAVIDLLNNDKIHVLKLLENLSPEVHEVHGSDLAFPPSALIGTTDFVEDSNQRHSIGMIRRRQGGNSSSATVAASLPASARSSSHNGSIPPIVSRRIICLCSSLCKSSPRVAFSMLFNGMDDAEHPNESCLDKLLDLFDVNQYSKSATNLDQLLSLLEIVVAPLSLLPKDATEVDIAAERSSPGREWVKVPRVVVSKRRLHLLINTLRLDGCKDSSFLKVNTLTRRLSRVEANRQSILHELALVAEGLGRAAILDLKAVSVRLSSAAAQHHRERMGANNGSEVLKVPDTLVESDAFFGIPSSAVSLSTSNSELKLLRVLQMLSSLCAQDDETKSEGNPPEFVSLLQSLKLESLWDQLVVCLKTVSVLEGVANIDLDENEGDGDEDDSEKSDDALSGKSGKKLQNSVAGLITRFLPAIEAFFMVNACSPVEEEDQSSEQTTFACDKVVQFAASNKILLNALLRSNPQLLEKGLRAMVKMSKCRLFLDFDVKRQWFKTQVRRLRQQASRRHGSFRINLRREHVFEDTFITFDKRTADELRGRLHITFRNEEGVDAGGLSREFFAILAKEMFNPNYALFTSTEDGCTFQPNPNSSINPYDLRYFRFVGRIVGKAVVDGFLLDAHFTRSLYKHMLGVKPTHHDMQAIDPDYYKNLLMILEHNLDDIGIELTFSTEDHSFGQSRTIDLIPNGRNTPVTDETKEHYVDLVCQHRMTSSIEKQITAFLDGWNEMVDPDLISIFSAKELELLISGMPDIDIHDLKKNTEYNGYRPADKEIGWFWNIMFGLKRSEKAAFLQFVTGSSKVPLAGFSELSGMRGVQKFSICKASGPKGALMSAHTCFNTLDLPVYNSEEEMKEKLLYAISEGSGGFGFA